MAEPEGNREATPVDVVLIGLNVASTLRDCLQSVLDCDREGIELRVFYVDGGSDDGSPELAGRFPDVTILRTSSAHTAPGLQRNLGFDAGRAPYVQFLDADTIMDSGWLRTGLKALAPGVAAVCGMRRERRPEASVYNWLADQEWNGPAGDCEAFGGDVLVRREALAVVGGYDPELVGGEDPELSRRLRAAGWRILRLDAPMTTHDIAMHSPLQWLRRAYRTGYGFAAVVSRQAPDDTFWRVELRRILIRGGGAVTAMLFALASLLAGLWGPAAAILAAGSLALLYPRLFRTDHFASSMRLDPRQARVYAWHCSLVAVPEFLGVLRHEWGRRTGRPLRNRPRRPAPQACRLVCLLIAVCLGLASCTSVRPTPTPRDNAAGLQTAVKKSRAQYATPDAVDQFSSAVPDSYLLGPGDVLKLEVWNRPEISGPNLVVGPDGSLAVNRIGQINVRGKTVPQAEAEIKARLEHFYDRPEVTLFVEKYTNNKAFVLGRVTSPGVVNFPGRGNLLEALALAGGLPVLQKDAFLTRCSIIRGKHTIIWIDLRDLLENGNMALNAALQNNDIVFIPESEDELIYVMGEVKTPGAIRLKARLSLMDAVMMAGGPSEDADLAKAYIIRFDGEKGQVTEIDMKRMLSTGIMAENYLLQASDVVYLAPTRLSDFNYALKKILPSLQVLDMGTNIMERFGVMQEIRSGLFPGQQNSDPAGTPPVIVP